MRTAFISDVHLGSRHARAADLLQFLDGLEGNAPQRLYIIGDFIDGWKARRNWYWGDDANRVVRKILGLLRDGTEVYYAPGNHDEFLREFIEEFRLADFGGVQLGNEFVHRTADGRRLLVVHGDVFDMVVRYGKWVCRLGDIGYETLLWLNRAVNWVRRKFGLRRWSLSKAVKHNVKMVANYLSDFESCLIAYGRERGCDGCVCGHVHTAELRDSGGFLYCNSGDWVESCTAVVEDDDGTLRLYRHHEN